jgi:hypothetical protein
VGDVFVEIETQRHQLYRLDLWHKHSS